MKTLEEVVKYMYNEMVSADNKAFGMMGKVVLGDPTTEEEKEYTHLSERAMTIEDILLAIIDKDKKKELLEAGIKKPDIHTYTDCFLFEKRADISEDGVFTGWIGNLYLYTKSHEMTPDELWNLYKNYL